MKKGFTLIELLVVVMIIGILAAIALPQYTTAVNKSRYAGLMPLARSVKNAEEIAFMSDGQYTATLSDLSVNLPGDVNQDGQAGVKISLGGGSEGKPNYVKATDTRINNNYVMYFDKSTNYPKEIHCEAKDGDAAARQVCLSLVADSSKTATATESGYTAYVMEGEGGTDIGGTAGSRSTSWEWDGEEAYRGTDSNGISYAVYCTDGNLNSCGTVGEQWTDEDGISYWGQCYTDSMDSNYRCTSYPDWERYNHGVTEYCTDPDGLTCNQWEPEE